MKPTLQQEENLRTYLRKELRYRETYEEVYDHILTALQQKLQEVSFQDLVNQIIKDDFGGRKGLLEMEKRCHQTVTDEMIGLQWNYFKSNFKFPNLIYTLILFLTIYLTASKIGHASFIRTFLIFAGLIIPGIVILIRYFNVGYFTLDNKRSIKDSIIRKIAYLFYQIILFPSIIFLDVKKELDLFITEYTSIVALVITILILYILSFVKLSKDDFKIYAIK